MITIKKLPYSTAADFIKNNQIDIIQLNSDTYSVNCMRKGQLYNALGANPLNTIERLFKAINQDGNEVIGPLTVQDIMNLNLTE